MTNTVLIHCKPEIVEDKVLFSNHKISAVNNTLSNEVDLIVDDIEYKVIDGYYQDPDEQLCEHYGIDYDLVNCIELND